MPLLNFSRNEWIHKRIMKSSTATTSASEIYNELYNMFKR